MRKSLDAILKILKKHEAQFKELNLEKLFNSYFKNKFKQLKQKNYYLGFHLALCVDTKDPWKQNRIRFFSPILHVPIQGGGGQSNPTSPESGNKFYTTRVDQLNWAYPVSPMGGFDDCGLTWVPPAGSTVVIGFQNGNVKAPYYIGTTWQRTRGSVADSDGGWNYPMPEYDKIYKHHRKGYMVGKNDESQALPPFNTDNYQGYDLDSSVDMDLVPDAATKTTYPHIYGWKTPEKHMFRMDDGDPKCNRRFKRLEIQSSLGNYFLMKDDPYHYCGEWTNPKCQQPFFSITPDICFASTITYTDLPQAPSTSVVPFAYVCAQGPDYCSTTEVEGFDTPLEVEYLGTEFLCPGFSPPEDISTIPIDCLGVLGGDDFCHNFNNVGKNKYHKHKQECYPFLAGKCALIQSGIQILSRSMHSFVMDDSVEEPRNRPEWERALEEFDYDGCTGNFKGKTYWESATGHLIEMNDEEDQPKIRNSKNGINIQSATGNQIFLNDESLPDCIAGPSRGIHIKSTAEHSLDMVDDGNRQCSGERHGCTKTGAWANKAFVRLRSGYGMHLIFNDAHNQKKTDQQYIQLLSPQTDNSQRGPHMLHMQEKAEGAGQVFLRSGGDYIVQTYDNMVEIVGDEKDNPSNKIELISRQKIINVKDVYYNKAKTHIFWADDYILLTAGKDCPISDTENGSCIYPVVVATTQIPENITALTGLRASEHVFASARKTPDDPCEVLASEI